MENALPRNKAEQSAPNKRQFTGTDNPRHLSALTVLQRRPISREELDLIAGCSNGPELVADLRRLGLGKEHLPCEQIEFIDREGFPCRPDVYYLTEQGRRMVKAWRARRDKDFIRKNFSNQELEGFNGPQ